MGKQDDKRECNLDCQHACTKLPLVMLLGNALNSKTTFANWRQPNDPTWTAEEIELGTHLDLSCTIATRRCAWLWHITSCWASSMLIIIPQLLVLPRGMPWLAYTTVDASSTRLIVYRLIIFK